MGQSALERPICAKESDSGSPSGCHDIAWSSSCMQGWRNNMEDAHICLPELPSPWGSVAMFGVLDGHGGEQVAKFCQRHLPEELHNRLCDARPWAISQSKATPLSEGDLRHALTSSFHCMDDELRSGNHAAELKSLTNPPCLEAAPRPMAARNGAVDVNMVGCTCCICCITEEFILCANAGDSRAVLCRRGRAVSLSEDHKPNLPTEQKRIKDAGGYVETQSCAAGTQYRVNGNLNLSRALGDLEYKKDRSRGPEAQIISGTPDFMCERRCDEDEFIILCCDGVWDVKTEQQVVDFIRTRLPPIDSSPFDGRAPAYILEDLLDDCVSPDLRATKGLGGDNMTAVLVRFPPKSRAARPVAKLLSVRMEATAATAGMLLVKFALPASPRLGLRSICIGFCETTGELELCLAGNDAPQTFDLQAHLPEAAELYFPSVEPSVKLFAKANILRAGIPWRWKRP